LKAFGFYRPTETGINNDRPTYAWIARISVVSWVIRKSYIAQSEENALGSLRACRAIFILDRAFKADAAESKRC
jgi:hypothetical protein